MSPGWGRILRVGLTAGLLMNVVRIANSALLPSELAAATTLVGLIATVPTAWLVWKILFRQEQHIE